MNDDFDIFERDDDIWTTLFYDNFYTIIWTKEATWRNALDYDTI